MRRMTRASLLSLLAALAFVSISSAAYAAEYWYRPHYYCAKVLAPDGTCPPNGNSWYMHLEWNKGNAGSGEYETCIDAYIDEGGGYYTEQKCVYHEAKGEAEIEQYTPLWYGYPRAWNGGKVEHYVGGAQTGYCEQENC